MSKYVFGIVSGLFLALIIGEAADSAGRDQCKRITHAKECELIYVPATEPGGGE